MDTLYYTPKVEDLHIGYECEILGQSTSKLIKKVDWHKVEVGFHQEIGEKVGINQVPGLIKAGKIRTPYLSAEQIKKEGWKLRTEYTGYYRFVFEKGNSWLSFNPEERSILIMPIDPVKEFYEYNLRYAGSCPSINEFRKICKLIGVAQIDYSLEAPCH